MKKTKLFEIISSFNKKEIREYRDFINSPYFNKEKVQSRLAEFFFVNYPYKNEDILEKDNVFQFIYPGKDYNDGLMRNIISDALKLAQKFLIIQNLDKNPLKADLVLLEELKERNLKANFIKHKKEIDIKLESLPFKNNIYYEMKAETKRIYHSFLRGTEDRFITSLSVYEEAAEMFSAAYLINILFYNTYLINNQAHFTNKNYNFIFANEVDNFLSSEGSRYLDIPEIRTRYYSFKLIQTGNENYFYKLKEILSSKQIQLTPTAKKDIQTILENFCYRMVTEGKADFVREQFLIYKQSIEEGTAKGAKGYISNILFLSIIATGFEAGEFGWTDNFISNYIYQTKVEVRNDLRYFSTALRAYWKNEYSLSLEALSKVKADDLAFRHNIRSLMLKIFYDLNEDEPFYLHIDSYKHFILNNENINSTVKDQVNKFINYAKRLFALKNNNNTKNKDDSAVIYKSLVNEKGLINKIWLIKKAEEILH